MNSSDFLTLQISQFGPARDDLKTEKLPDEGTTRYAEVGEGERDCPLGD